VRFDITPLDGMIDGELAIRLVEGSPRSRVTIIAEAEDALGRMWSASGQYLVSEDGTVDLTREAPIQGSYSTLDPLGIVTSMTPLGKEPASLFATPDASDMRISLTVRERDTEAATALVLRRYKAAAVSPHRVDEGPIGGTLYVPGGTEPRPAIVVVPGVIGAGACAQPMAALLASRGYVTFCVDLLGRPGLPETLTEYPLEHLADVVAWLCARPGVQGDAVAALGIEKGAELVLAGVSFLPDIPVRCVVTIAPTCVAWQGAAPTKTPISSWTVGGQPVPFAPVKLGGGQKLLRSLTKKEGGAVSQLAAHTEAFTAEALRRAALPIERYPGPILLLAGFDDQQWPSGEMAELIYRARRAEHCNEGDQKLTFPKVGRLIRFPHLPAASSTRYLDPNGGGYILGGAPDANQHADEVGWAKIVEFVGANLGVPVAPPATDRSGDTASVEPSVIPPTSAEPSTTAPSAADDSGVDEDGTEEGGTEETPAPPPQPPAGRGWAERAAEVLGATPGTVAAATPSLTATEVAATSGPAFLGAPVLVAPGHVGRPVGVVPGHSGGGAGPVVAAEPALPVEPLAEEPVVDQPAAPAEEVVAEAEAPAEEVVGGAQEAPVAATPVISPSALDPDHDQPGSFL
jgi:dienelactone hydrolase